MEERPQGLPNACRPPLANPRIGNFKYTDRLLFEVVTGLRVGGDADGDNKEFIRMPTSISDLKKQAREIARASDLTYCQALDALARQHGAKHWKDYVQTRDDVLKSLQRSFEGLKARANEIGPALRAGALIGALTDSEMSYDQRFGIVEAVIKGRAPSDVRRVHIDVATHIVALLAHKALVDGDHRLEPKLWAGRPICIEMIRDTILDIRSQFATAEPEDRYLAAATWSWLNDISSIALDLGYEQVAMAFASATALSHEDQQTILNLAVSLAEPQSLSLLARSDINPRQREEARITFLKMIVESYMLRTGQHGSEFFELAEVNLGVYLEDHKIEFGDPSRTWNRDLANEIANADMDVWPQFA